MPDRFRPGDRVRVSAEHPWAANAEGAVADAWPQWPREAHAEDGSVTTFVLVTFDAPRSDGEREVQSAEFEAGLLTRV
jgi:hypothetical protein